MPPYPEWASVIAEDWLEDPCQRNPDMRRQICKHEASRLREGDTVAYFLRLGCEFLFAQPDFLAAVDAGAADDHCDSCGERELPAARKRSFGRGVAWMAETLRMARPPARRALDIASGPGFCWTPWLNWFRAWPRGCTASNSSLLPAPAHSEPELLYRLVWRSRGAVRRRRMH